MIMIFMIFMIFSVYVMVTHRITFTQQLLQIEYESITPGIRTGKTAGRGKSKQGRQSASIARHFRCN